MVRSTLTGALVALLATFVAAGVASAQGVTETPAETCARLAAAPDDPDGTGEGVANDAVDLPAAETACRLAIEADPDDRHA